MGDICRLCGDLKPLESLTCLKECTVAYQLENHLNISLDCDKMLANSVCDNCCQNVSFCCEFIEQVNAVQLRLKADLAEQLQMVTYDPFIADEELKEVNVKIERIYTERFVNIPAGVGAGGSQSLSSHADKVPIATNKQRRIPDKKDCKTVSRRMFVNRQRGNLKLFLPT